MKKLRIIDLYIIPLFFVSISAAVLRTVALLTSFNAATMHYDDKLAITISGVLVTITVIGFLTYLFLGEKERELISRSDNARSYIPAGLMSIALLFMGVNSMGVAFSGQIGIIPVVAILCALLAFLSTASFFLSVFIEKNEHIYKAAFSLSIVLFLALYSILLFFNRTTHPTNSPNKIVDQLAYVASAIFFLYDSRIYLARVKWRGYVAFGLIAALLTSYSALPSLIAYAVNGYVVSDSIIESLLTMAISILACSKVIQIRTLTPAEECESAKSISALAMLRREEMEEQRRLSRAQNTTIKEEDDAIDASNYTFDIPEAEPRTDFSPDGAEIDLTQTNQ